MYKPPCVCNGRGYIIRYRGMQKVKVQCKVCGGTGKKSEQRKMGGDSSSIIIQLMCEKYEKELKEKGIPCPK